MSTGYIKLYRALKQSAFYKDSEYVHLWVHLLMSVNRTEKRLKIEKSDRFITLLPGQVLTSRDKLSEQTGIHRSKVDRILKAFQSEQQIEQQTSSKYRVISISNWKEYQCSEQQNEPQVSHNRAASEPQVSTNKKEEEETTTASVDAQTKCEKVFSYMFKAKADRFKKLFPEHNFEVLREACIAYYSTQPPPINPYSTAIQWFQRQQLSAPATFAKSSKPKRGLSDDFEKSFLEAD